MVFMTIEDCNGAMGCCLMFVISSSPNKIKLICEARMEWPGNGHIQILYEAADRKPSVGGAQRATNYGLYSMLYKLLYPASVGIDI